MNQQEVHTKVVDILRPFIKNTGALEALNPRTSLLGDLQINSARMVDIVLEMEDAFGIAVKDEDADRVETVGDAVELVLRLRS